MDELIEDLERVVPARQTRWGERPPSSSGSSRVEGAFKPGASLSKRRFDDAFRGVHEVASTGQRVVLC